MLALSGAPEGTSRCLHARALEQASDLKRPTSRTVFEEIRTWPIERSLLSGNATRRPRVDHTWALTTDIFWNGCPRLRREHDVLRVGEVVGGRVTVRVAVPVLEVPARAGGDGVGAAGEGEARQIDREDDLPRGIREQGRKDALHSSTHASPAVPERRVDLLRAVEEDARHALRQAGHCENEVVRREW